MKKVLILAIIVILLGLTPATFAKDPPAGVPGPPTFVCALLNAIAPQAFAVLQGLGLCS